LSNGIIFDILCANQYSCARSKLSDLELPPVISAVAELLKLN